jgi:predicted metalloprotease with PDZ domain
MANKHITPDIVYSIRVCDVHAHLYAVEIDIPKALLAAGQTSLRLRMPAWIPGSYMIREFARQVSRVQCSTACQQIDKDTWEVRVARANLKFTYEVYAFDTSVRGAYLDANRGFFNASCLCFEVLDLHSVPGCQVELAAPKKHLNFPQANDWRVATALPKLQADARGFGRYRAVNFDALIDQPVEMGLHIQTQFLAGGAEHHIVIAGMGGLALQVDLERLRHDFKKIVDEQLRLFDPSLGRAPMKAYWFLINTLAEGYGGLEHRDSTVLLCSRAEMPLLKGPASARGDSNAYRGFLGLVSHEYFHTWNIKRIKPAAFVPYDTSRENYSRLLWIFEGFTSYYDDLILLRAGLLNCDQYLSQLAKALCAVARDPGAQRDTVAQSSFNAWTRYYRQDENSPNTLVSYYVKGSLVALCLDLTIRLRTKGKRSLDDVMRLMWQRFGQNFYSSTAPQGLAEDAFANVLEQACGIDLTQEIQEWAYDSSPLPTSSLLEEFGVSTTRRSEPWAALGAKLAIRGSELKLTTVYNGGAAHHAGLSAGDQLVAIGGFRATETMLQTQLEQYAGEAVTLHAFRHDELLELELTVPDQGAQPNHKVELRCMDKPRAAARKRLDAWRAPWPIRKA